MLSGPQLRLSKFSLAAWLLIVATSPAFSHDHPEGDKPHGHGLGVFLTSCSACNLCSTKSRIAPDTRHSHMVLFGMEIHIPASCPWALGQNSPLPVIQSFFGLNAQIENAASVSQSTADEFIDVVQSPLTGLSVFSPDTPREKPSSLGVDPFLCDLARRLCSGTQQL